MGSGESKESASETYVNGDDSVLELPQALHSGPIHSLAVVDDHHLISGGADKVRVYVRTKTALQL